ncbi:MAG: hypothetical protein ACXABY_21770, partial [Candidatus Thorarchaeota archaeon]
FIFILNPYKINPMSLQKLGDRCPELKGSPILFTSERFALEIEPLRIINTDNSIEISDATKEALKRLIDDCSIVGSLEEIEL